MTAARPLQGTKKRAIHKRPSHLRRYSAYPKLALLADLEAKRSQKRESQFTEF
jgi:hypothetical protein